MNILTSSPAAYGSSHQSTFYDADCFLIRCFSPEKLWQQVWTMQNMPWKHLQVINIPLQGGSSTKPKHFLSLFEKHKANPVAPVFVATHSPCGFYGNRPEVAIEDGKKIAEAFDQAGFQALHTHIDLNVETGEISTRFYNPSRIVISNPLIEEMITVALDHIAKIQILDMKEALLPHPDFELIVAKVFINQPDHNLLIQREYLTAHTLEIATKLKREANPGNPDISLAVHFVDNYIVAS